MITNRLVPFVITTLLGVSMAYGSTAIYILQSGSGSGQVNVEADFNLSSLGALTLTLKNLQANPQDVTQVVTGFVFSLQAFRSAENL